MWSGSRREHGDLGRLDRGPHRRALDETELLDRRGRDLRDEWHRAVDPNAHAVAEQLDALHVPAATLRGLPVGRSRCSATECGWTTASAAPVPASGDDERARRVSRSTRVAVRRCRGAGSRRRARRRSSSAGRAETSANVPHWTTRPCSRMTRRSASAAASSGSWVTSRRTPAERREVTPQLAPHRAPRALVERGERFVEEQQPRFGGERARERDPLRLPARERARLLARERRPGRPRSSAAAPRRARGAAPGAAAAEAERDVLEHREVREEQVVLEHDADRPALGRREDAAAVVEHRRRRARCGRDRSGRGRRARAAASSCPRRSARAPRRSRRRRPAARRRVRANRAGVRRARTASRPSVSTRVIRHRASGRAAARAPRCTPRAARCSARSRHRGSSRAGGRRRAVSSGCGPGCCRRT